MGVGRDANPGVSELAEQWVDLTGRSVPFPSRTISSGPKTLDKVDVPSLVISDMTDQADIEEKKRKVSLTFLAGSGVSCPSAAQAKTTDSVKVRCKDV